MIESFGLTDRGFVRESNQDRIATDHSLLWFTVADGMGGHNRGERAAELAISSIRSYLQSSRDRFDVTWPLGYDFKLSIDANRLSTAIQIANRSIWQDAEGSPDSAGMGTAVATVLLHEDRAVVGNVGDSRVYLFRQGKLCQISIDDTFVNTILPHGALTPEELSDHPMRHVLTQAAGMQKKLDVHIRESPMESDDLFLLSSDGLHGVVGECAMRKILSAGGTLEGMAADLLEACRARGAPDNISCLLVSYSV